MLVTIPEDVLMAVVRHQRIPLYDGSPEAIAGGQRCSGCDHLKGKTDGCNSPRVAAHQIEMLRQHLAKEQFGVQVVYADPVASGSCKKGEVYEPRWHWFEDKDAADRFSQRYAHEIGRDPKWGGVTEVNRATRWAIEVYGEPQSTGKSYPCHAIKPGDELPQAQCLLLKDHDGQHDMMGLVQWS